MSRFSLTSHSLSTHPAGPAVEAVLQAALQAADPQAAVRAALGREGDSLRLPGGRALELGNFRRVLLLAVGKAGAPMAQAAAGRLGERLSGGLVVVKDGHLPPADQRPPGLQFCEASHPLPDERGVQAARQALALLDGMSEDDLLLFLVSGGGSALFSLPVPPIRLADLQSLTGQLLACGATITEINTLRKHLDRVKGGGLAQAAAPGRVVGLVLSDVVGSPLEIIASGPSVPDPSTYGEALAVLERYGLAGSAPPAILAHLREGSAGRLPETPKPGDPIFTKVDNFVVADNRQAVEAAAAAASRLGAEAVILTTRLEGEARLAGAWLAGELAARLDSRPGGGPALCLLAGGETTVTLAGQAGLGGRNQELALSLVESLAGQAGVLAASLATDGGDGPTDAAGAVVSGATLERARRLGLDPAASLSWHDSYHFFAALGDLLKPGPTRTNVNDLAVVWVEP